MPRATPFAAAAGTQQQQQQQQPYYTVAHFPGRRPSPFQEAAAVLQLGAAPDAGRSSSNSWAARPQQQHHHYLDVFEPLDAGARADALSSSSAAASRHGYQAFYVRSNNTMHVMMLQSGGSSASHMSHAAHHNTILQLRTQALMRSASSDGGSSSSSAANAARGVERASRQRSSSSTGGGPGSPMQRLQRRSHSLLAATSATATQVWASITDRSRSLLCISDPGGSSRSASGRRSSSSVDGADVAAAAAAAVAGAGMPASAGSTTRVTRLSARMLTRSTSIHRSRARSAAVLIDVDATESSYDDLVALDQFAVKRAVRSSVLVALPCRMPCAEDAAQQRQCHICFEAWALPPQQQQQQPHSGDRSADVCNSSRAVGRTCCSCGLPTTPRHQHQQPQHRSPWSSPVGHALAAAPPPRQGRLVPAPAAAELLLSASEALDECDPEPTPGGGSSSSAPSSEYADARSSTSSAEFVDALEVPAPYQGPRRPLSFDAWITSVAAAGDGGAARRPVLHGSQMVVLTAGYGRAASAPHAGNSAHACCSCRPPVQQPVQRQQQGLVAALPKVLIRKLPCGHEFCCGCIRTWLKEHHTCPVCRWAFPERDTRLINK